MAILFLIFRQTLVIGQGILLVTFNQKISSLAWLGEPLFSSWLFLFTNPAWALVLFSSFLLAVKTWGGELRLTLRWWVFWLSLGEWGALTTSEFLVTRSPTPLPNLFNGVVFIHPVILYLGWSFAIVGLLNILTPQLGKKFYTRTHSSALGVGLTFTVIALLLGASWAQQELNWGGWWSWDLVEAGTVLIFLSFFLPIHNRTVMFPAFWSSLYLGSLLLFFFLGLRYGLFNSVHSFAGSSQTDYKTQAGFYGLTGVIALRYIKPTPRHSGLAVTAAIIYIVGLAFLGEFLGKYYNLPWYWPLSSLLTLVLLVWFVTWHQYHRRIIILGWAPYFVNGLAIKWAWKFRGRIFHQVFLLTWVGVLLTKFPLPIMGFLTDSGDQQWISHLTYLTLSQDFSAYLPENASVTGYNLTTQSPQWWGYRLLPIFLPSPTPLTYYGWGLNFQVYWVLQTTVGLTVILGFISLGLLILIKKSPR